MGILDSIRADISRLNPKNETAVHQFQQRIFSPHAYQITTAHFHWLFNLNPSCQDEEPQLWVYQRNQEVHGQQAGIPFDLKVGGHHYEGSWSIDWLVEQQWRLRGIGPILNEMFVEANDVSVALGVSNYALTGLLKQGWTDLGHIPVFLRPLDVTTLVKALLDRGSLARIIGATAVPFTKLVNYCSDTYTRFKHAELEPIDQFDHRADSLWQEAMRYYRVIGQRDYETLHWRFDLSPVSEVYERFYLMEHGKLRGYVVLRLRHWRGVTFGVIVDYLTPPASLMAMFSCCVKHFRLKGVAVVRCDTLNSPAEATLGKLGFIRWQVGSRFMVGPFRNSQEDSNLLLDPTSWYITLADSDADHRPER